MHYTKKHIVWQHGPTRQRVVRSVQLCRVRQTVIPTAGLHPGAQPRLPDPACCDQKTGFYLEVWPPPPSHTFTIGSHRSKVDMSCSSPSFFQSNKNENKLRRKRNRLWRVAPPGVLPPVCFLLLKRLWGGKVLSCWLGPQWRHFGAGGGARTYKDHLQGPLSQHWAQTPPAPCGLYNNYTYYCCLAKLTEISFMFFYCNVIKL